MRYTPEERLDVGKRNPYGDKRVQALWIAQEKMISLSPEKIEAILAEYCNLTPTLMRELRDQTICDHCNHPIDDIWAEHYQHNRWYVFHLKCHGDEEIHEFTEVEFAHAMHSQAKSRAFLHRIAELPPPPKHQIPMQDANEAPQGLGPIPMPETPAQKALEKEVDKSLVRTEPNPGNPARPQCGRIAYDAYCKTRGWKAFDGKPLPQWEGVQFEIQVAWELAANAAVTAHLEYLLLTVR